MPPYGFRNPYKTIILWRKPKAKAETSSLGNRQIMPGNLNKIVLSWIRPLEELEHAISATLQYINWAFWWCRSVTYLYFCLPPRTRSSRTPSFSIPFRKHFWNLDSIQPFYTPPFLSLLKSCGSNWVILMHEVFWHMLWWKFWIYGISFSLIRTQKRQNPPPRVVQG